jgi:hypothetical protein
MLFMLVRHKVRDFAAWKAVFDSHATAQQQAGLHVKQLLHNVDNPNELFLLFEAEDLERAKGFVSSPQVPDARAASGVLEEPDLYFLRAD